MKTQTLIPFDILHSVPDLPLLLFSRFDPSTLTLAACVCLKWRDLARRVRDKAIKEDTPPLCFQLSFRALVHSPAALAWAVDNLGEKHLPPKLRRDWVCSIAAQEGALEALQWARKHGCPWDAFTCAYAAKNGHLTVLQWAHENGCEWAADTCANAARNGHLSILQWARENGCDWDAWTTAQAARNGHLELLQWARENGCPWDKAMCMGLAKGYNHLVVAAWIEAQFNQQS